MKHRRRADRRARTEGVRVGANGAPEEGSDAGSNADLIAARNRATIGRHRATAARHFGTARRLLSRDRSAAEREARLAISSVVRAFWWAEDGPLEARQHAYMHEIGRWTRSEFGCHLDLDGQNYSMTCPILLAHKRMGLSIAFVAQRLCSICGGDLSECPHFRDRSYWVRGGPGPSGRCPVCMQDKCRHTSDRLFRVPVVGIINEVTELPEVSLVGRPAQPEARFVKISVPTADLMAEFGDTFVPGTPVSCDRCLGPCWGFDELPASD
ncbi:MAG: hypothetical protein ABSG64_05715 [Solirubrobacteraceae bacterium]